MPQKTSKIALLGFKIQIKKIKGTYSSFKKVM